MQSCHANAYLLVDGLCIRLKPCADQWQPLLSYHTLHCFATEVPILSSAHTVESCMVLTHAVLFSHKACALTTFSSQRRALCLRQQALCTCFAPSSPAMSFQDSDGLMSSTSDITASRSFASSAVSRFLSGPDRCLASVVDCLSRCIVAECSTGLVCL